MSPRPVSGLVIDIVAESPLWQSQRGVKAVLRRAVMAAAAAVSTTDGELAIVLTDDSAIRALNRQWRGKDEPTNVLSFPAPTPQGPRTMPHLLGDIVIAYETTAAEADAQGKAFAHHLGHLAIHGFLHLLGYDHAADGEAEAMERLEIAILAGLDVANPYIARDAKG